MEEEIEPSKEYVAAFNLGYKLNRISPEIAEMVDHISASDDRIAALKAGIEQQKEDAFESYTPEWMEDFDKGLTDIEPDKDDM